MSDTVLYVDDEEKNLRVFEASFYLDYNIITAISGEVALDVLSKNEIAVLITDQKMPGMTGVELLATAKVKYPKTMRIILTGFSEMAVIKEGINTGWIFKYLEKPWDNREVTLAIEEALTIYKKQ